jgi:hypothetical protein
MREMLLGSDNENEEDKEKEKEKSFRRKWEELPSFKDVPQIK